MLTIELATRDIPEYYRRFAKEIGERHWKARAAALFQERKGNPFLERLHTQEDAITLQLERLREMQHRHGGMPVIDYNNHAIFPAASFATQVVSVLENSSEELAERFRRRIHGAFRNPAEMRAVRLELATATHFLRAGRTVSFPEMSSAPAVQGLGMPDLLIEDLGPNGLEVECKSFSQEKGRRIGRRQALEFFWLLKKRHWGRLKSLEQGVCAVITVPKSVSLAYKERIALVDAAAHIILACVVGNHEVEGARISLVPVDPEQVEMLNRIESVRELRDLMDVITGTTNKETIVIGTPAGGGLTVALQSEEDDTMLAGMMETLKQSAPRQFSGRRPGIFAAGFEGLAADQLLEIARQDQRPDAVPSGLQLHTSRFLEMTKREHLVGVAFFSADSLRPAQAHAQDSGGTAYYFPKKSGPFWSDDLSGIFGRRAGEYSVS